MKKQFAFCLILCFALFVLSCEKDPPPARQIFYMDNEFKDNSFFKPGTWWVYQLDTLTEDSVAVISSQFILQEPDTADYSWQQSELEYSSSYYNDTILLKGDFLHSASVFYLTQHDSSEILNFFSLKPPGYTLEISPALQMKYRELKDTVINGQPFSGVRIFENLVTPQHLHLPREIWYAPNIGVIRKVLFNGEEWQLNRYQIVQ